MIKKIKDNFFTKQFFTFVLVGIVNTFAGTLFSILYSKVFQPNVAFIIGYLSGTIVSFILNSIFTFKSKITIKKYPSFLLNVIPNFIIQNITVYLVYNLWHKEELIAYIIAAIVGIPVTFLLLKYNTFRRTHEKR